MFLVCLRIRKVTNTNRGVEKAFKKKFGNNITAKVGYIGGSVKNPTYNQVCTGNTGHAEAIQINFDESKIDYKALVDFFYRMHDPCVLNKQGNDTGRWFALFIT